MFRDTLPLQLLSKNHFFWFFWNGVYLPPSSLDNVFKYTVFFDGTHYAFRLLIVDMFSQTMHVNYRRLKTARCLYWKCCCISSYFVETCSPISASFTKKGNQWSQKKRIPVVKTPAQLNTTTTAGGFYMKITLHTPPTPHPTTPERNSNPDLDI